ncbi:MAG: hypothetical protein U9Q15_02290 [Patescibacteria group bacterium]|nr:hypothetical protein [Patescibacteria group bacterium]
MKKYFKTKIKILKKILQYILVVTLVITNIHIPIEYGYANEAEFLSITTNEDSYLVNESIQYDLEFKTPQDIYGIEFTIPYNAALQYPSDISPENSIGDYSIIQNEQTKRKVLWDETPYGKHFTVIQNKNYGFFSKDSPIISFHINPLLAGNQTFSLTDVSFINSSIEIQNHNDISKSIQISLPDINGFKYESIDDSSIKISWDEIENTLLDYYIIYKKAQGDTSFSEYKKVNNNYFYEDILEKNNTEYKVIGSSNNIRSSLNSAPSLLFSHNDTNAPTTVSYIITTESNEGIHLLWPMNPEKDILHYNIWKQSPNEEFINIGQSQSNSFLDTDVQYQQTYQYFITVQDNNQNISSDSEIISITYSIEKETSIPISDNCSENMYFN